MRPWDRARFARERDVEASLRYDRDDFDEGMHSYETEWDMPHWIMACAHRLEWSACVHEECVISFVMEDTLWSEEFSMLQSDAVLAVPLWHATFWSGRSSLARLMVLAQPVSP